MTSATNTIKSFPSGVTKFVYSLILTQVDNFALSLYLLAEYNPYLIEPL